MKVAVRCEDGSKRLYLISDEFPYDEVAGVVKAEVKEAKTVLVEVIKPVTPEAAKEAA